MAGTPDKKHEMNSTRQMFERLAAGLQKPLYNTALRLTGNVEDGLDLARETFVQAYVLFRTEGRSGAFRPWLYQVLLDLYTERQQARAEAPSWMQTASKLDLYAASPGVEGVRDLFGSGRGFYAEEGPAEHALAALPEDLRVAFLLGDVEGFSYAQVARILRCPPAAIGGRLLEARRLLRAELRRHSTRRPPIER